MTKAKQKQECFATEIVAALRDKQCWNVACGGSVGSTFQLALGGKVPRERLLKNPTVSSDYRRFEGEVGLLVWCVWRLVGSKGPLTSWDDDSPHRDERLRRLSGRTIVDVTIPYNWLLQIEFSGGLVLTVFPDHVGENASFDSNWEVWTPERLFSVNTQLVCDVEERSVPAYPVIIPMPERNRKPSFRTARGGRIKGYKSVANG